MSTKVGTIIMSGISIGWFNITDRVNTEDNRGAKWTVQCPMKHVDILEKGLNQNVPDVIRKSSIS